MFKMVFSTSVNSATSVASLLQIPIKAMPTFWFLYVLILFYAFFVLAVHSKNAIKIVCISSAIACLAQNLIISLLPSVTAVKFFQYLFFFTMGLLWRDVLSERVRRRSILISCVGVVLLLVYLYQYGDNLSGWTVMPFWGGILAFCLCAALVNAGMYWEGKAEMKLLCYLGRHSLAIYVMHVIVTAGARTVTSKIGMSIVPVRIMISFILGVVAPLLVEWMAKKTKTEKLLFRPF